MESLLSLSFDSLASYDGSKIRKGLKQLEGLLAQICLSKASFRNGSSSRDRRQSIAGTTSRDTTPKELSQLKDDPAFREFFKLQEGFEWNCAIRLIGCLERLLGRGSNGQNDLLIVSTLDVLHGVLLMHPPSCSLFVREIYMNLLLDLLDPTFCPAIQSAALVALVTALLHNPRNTRTFEALDGLLTVASLFKSRSTTREVKMKSVEFLYFYLMPETPSAKFSASLSAHFSPSIGSASSWGASVRSLAVGAKEEVTRSTHEKQALLGKYLSNVEDLVEDLRESSVLGGSVF